MRTTIERALWASLLASSLVLAGVAGAQTSPEAKGTESKDSQWNAMNVEKIDALELVGDVENGKAAYEEECAGCHLASGAGRPDGKFPQLAGQHDTVLIKQIADIRAGRRDNPVMHPYSMKLIDAQEIADVSAYLQALPIPPGNGTGSGAELAAGEKLYRHDCVSCHGEHGEGSEEKFYPVLAGQHYGYMLRQIRDIAAGERRNANPAMVKVVKRYTDEQLKAVVDYMSTLRWPGRAAKSGG
jgi:cbb3-type cytochrome c oxidase subunit III